MSQKFYLLSLYIFFCCLQAIFAQSPAFDFSESNYDSTQLANIRANLESYRINLNVKQKKDLIQALNTNKIAVPDLLYIVKQLGMVLNQSDRQKRIDEIEKEIEQSNSEDYKVTLAYEQELLHDTATNDYQEGYYLCPFMILDFNKDKAVDLILVPRVYFGPSEGYVMYVNQKGNFEYIFDNSGYFTTFQASEKSTRLWFSVSIIDAAETNISQCLEFDHQKQMWKAEPKLYYAQQTEIPQKLEVPQLCKLKTNAYLRFSPKINDSPRPTSNDYYDTTTITIKGNIVAQFAKNANAFVLAKKQDWLFVAFKPDNKALQSSLKHGMDSHYYEKDRLIEGTRIKPYLCGWIRKTEAELLK